MSEQEAREILLGKINPDGDLFATLPFYIEWSKGHEYVLIDGGLSADEVEAIAVIMRASNSAQAGVSRRDTG